MCHESDYIRRHIEVITLFISYHLIIYLHFNNPCGFRSSTRYPFIQGIFCGIVSRNLKYFGQTSSEEIETMGAGRRAGHGPGIMPTNILTTLSSSMGVPHFYM